MSDVMMMLGGLKFSVNTAAYQSFRRTSEFRWPAQERIGARPALQWVGPGRDTIELAGVIYPHYKGSLSYLDALALQSGTGVPLPLVCGLGYWYGFWCLERLSSDRSYFAAGGSPMKVEFRITISRFGFSL